jgi:orotate phosphoribosyltransferase
VTEKEVLKLFDKYGALLTGHFRLSSGLHSGQYLQCALVLQHPDVAEKLAKEIAGKFSGEKIDIVVGPALGGVTIAYEVARALGVRSIFTERHSSTGSECRPELAEGRQDGAMTLRRGFRVNPGEKVLVVEDVVTTGGSTKEVIDVVERAGGKVTGVGCIIDRSGGRAGFGVRFEGLAEIEIETFDEKTCPFCKKGEVLTKPGSRK